MWTRGVKKSEKEQQSLCTCLLKAFQPMCLEMTIADWLSSYLEGSFPRFACQMVITEKGPKYTGVVLLGTIQKIGKVHSFTKCCPTLNFSTIHQQKKSQKNRYSDWYIKFGHYERPQKFETISHLI